MGEKAVTTILDYDDETLDAIADSAEQISRVKKWFEEAKKAREPQSERWRKNEKLYYGKHWMSDKGSNTKLVYNFPFSNVETILPIIADHLPTVDIMPKEEDDVEFADMVQSRFNHLAEQSELYDKVLEQVKDMLIYSNGDMDILPILDEDESLVGLDVRVDDPFTVFPHHWATCVDDAKHIIFATPMHVDDIEEQYGVKVSPEGNLDDYRSFQTAVEGDERDGDDMALVIECFSRDVETDKYPEGRFTAIVRDQLLTDEPLELTRVPHFMIGNYKSAHTWYGISEPEIVKTQTKTTNEVMSAIADNIREAGNPIRKMTKRFQAANPNGINPHAGGKVIVDRKEDLSWDSPPSMPAYVQQYLETTMLLKDAVSGIQDVTAGRQPTGITAASAITALQEAAQTRVRFKITKDISKLIKDIGKYVVWLIQTYDEKVLMLRETDANGGYEFKKFDPKAVHPKTEKTFAESRFDISVATGVRQPTGRVAAEERAITLFKEGIYGIEDVVLALNEPNKQKLIERYYKRQQGGESEVPPEVMEQFEVLAQSAQPGSPEEEQLLAMIQEYPQLQEMVQA